MQKIDLRSDTVTLPSPQMRDAMYKAELGDDVFGDDPTVNRLQEMAAARVGKEAALFVASGTMGNLVSLLTHCQRGDEVILGTKSHIFRYEQGGMAALAGVHAKTLPNLPDGRLDPQAVEDAINPDDDHLARTRLICLENTWHGHVLKPEYVSTIKGIASESRLLMHLDGARIFNAAIALKKPVASLVSEFNSVQFCFSKGLSAPVGSIICGSSDFIKQARRNRKLVGGGMRQVGVLAAACIVALETMVDRLAEDHANAKRLAEGLATMPNIEIDPADVETNILFINTKPGVNVHEVVAQLESEGVRVLAYTSTAIRAVTHYGIEKTDIDATLLAFKKVLSARETGAARV